MNIDFIIYQEPTGKKAVMHTRSGIAYPCKAQKYNASALMTDMFKYRPSEPITDPVELKVVAFFNVPKSKPKWWKALAYAGLIPHDKKPDYDNLAKQIGDALETLQFIKNDSQIFHADINKWYSEYPRWEVYITSVPTIARR